MKKIVVAIPHSHTWLWTQTCIASLKRCPPKADGFEVEVVVVDNSPWSPAIRGICDTPLGEGVKVIPNHKSNKFHASALDCVVEDFEFDYLMALETDVIALRPTWLQWFVNQMSGTDFAVGMWHHEQFINPSCTLYRGNVLRDMMVWCKNHPDPDVLRWGLNFERTAPLDNNLPLSENPAAVLEDMKGWIGGPFAEKRGWPAGTVLKPEAPSGQLKGPGWYEPGQQLYHWALDRHYTCRICRSLTTTLPGLPLQTIYGPVDGFADPGRQLEAREMYEGNGNTAVGETAHLWGGTRALDILKHPVTCQFVKANTPMWLAREARFWRQVVPQAIQLHTLDLIRHYGWHTTGQGKDHVDDRDREAAAYVKNCYEAGGITW